MRIHCFQHVAFEEPGTIADWAGQNEYAITYTYFFEEDFSFPLLQDIDMLLIMGGYMNVDEEEKFPWLKKEKLFIKQAIHAGKKVMGICLGSQLISAVLGSRVYPGKEKEIGFFPIRFTDAASEHPLFNHFSKSYTVFHWHGDTFDLPARALLIASTDTCKHQAYMIGNRILALQVHLEMNKTIIEEMLIHHGHELEENGNHIHSPEQIRAGFAYLRQNKEDLFILLDKFLYYNGELI